jgi:acetyl-CoA carboxylase carboxyl transferase subunit beta
VSFLYRGRGKEGAQDEVLWVECPHCKEISYRKEVERHLYCCPKCDYHYPVTVEQRLQWIVDEGRFEELFLEIATRDPLKFKDERRYVDRLREANQRSAHGEAIIFGRAKIMSWPVILGVQDFSFLGGSMGSAVGERLVLAAEESMKTRSSLVIFAASGGARMQEGLLALMQMAKTSLALVRLKEVGLPFISVLTDPTTGGVAASFAMQGDVILAEPRAMVGFAGPRVIEKTIGQKLPEGFQRAEYLLEHGLIDRIVSRRQIRRVLGQLIGLLAAPIALETEDNEP